MSLYELRAEDTVEIARVAERMRATLIEVEGAETGAAMYSMDWLQDRVRFHLDPAQSQARVLIARDAQGANVGHTIFRIESANDRRYGLISTTYVLPEARRAGWAAQFLAQAHAWFLAQGVSESCTWTSSTNTPLIQLYSKHGYRIVEQGANDLSGTMMVRLARDLRSDEPPAHA